MPLAMARTRLVLDFLTRGHGHRYGPHRSQRADLHLPLGAGPHPVMVVIHGGSWQRRYGKLVMRGLVGDLLRRGWAAWNIEYRRVGDGGGWPHTFADVAAAIDHLASLDASIDLDSVSVLGHSAGGHLALWAAGRGGELSRRYASAAQAAGGTLELVEIEGAPGGHRAHIDPRGEAWAAVTRWLAQPLGGA
jgi:dipeptidyl aminopeptidase/acylaminoacyl peptidase